MSKSKIQSSQQHDQNIELESLNNIWADKRRHHQRPYFPRSNSSWLPHSRNQVPVFRLHLHKHAASSTSQSLLSANSLRLLPSKISENLQLIFHSQKNLLIQKLGVSKPPRGTILEPIASYHNFLFYSKPF
ncbi:hypothetical protein AVEN_54446-1 [Araneus ventricosus]|uniref:Uncharacterized protein n=1 Tax=Araneus ventricosus TaxID=182803 RepID=A0A4Y2TS73_ARAVE|nr:hypothetical protein AVEN_54446-1 [Araneus ventricosus]